MPERLNLPGPSRIRRGKEIRRVFDQGRSAARGAVVVYAWRRDDDLPPRYALVVGRKWGKANRRNRVRRLLRESFRTARPRLPDGYDFLLLPRGPLHGQKMQNVRRHLEKAASRAAERLGELLA
jgi:ribonuclease P protein component